MARIVNKNDFLKLPSNTLYREYEPYVIECLKIKGDSLEECSDFYVQYLDSTATDDCGEMCEMLKKGSGIKFDLNIEQRDAAYDDGQLYLVYGKDDIKQLINRLNDCTSY